MMEAILSPKTSVHTRDTRHNIAEDGILQDFSLPKGVQTGYRSQIAAYLVDATDDFTWGKATRA
jgi:hypothetical protein